MRIDLIPVNGDERQAKQLYEFGPFRIDPSERTLLRDGQSVPLTPKAFDLLLILVENSGRLVEKGELMKQLWPDAFVEEANLPNNISLLRKALSNECGGHNYIETVPRRGYRFTAEVVDHAGESAELIYEERIRSTLIMEQEEEESPTRTTYSRASLVIGGCGAAGCSGTDPCGV